jgi:hypothetical protein
VQVATREVCVIDIRHDPGTNVRFAGLYCWDCRKATARAVQGHSEGNNDDQDGNDGKRLGISPGILRSLGQRLLRNAASLAITIFSSGVSIQTHTGRDGRRRNAEGVALRTT